MNPVGINQAIARGIRKVLPKDIRAEVREDLTQEVWVILLEQGTLDTKSAYNKGRSVAKTWIRDRAKIPLIAQKGPYGVDEEDELLPWDKVDLSKPAQMEEQTITALSHADDAERERIFNNLHQDDRRFLARYCSQKRKHSPAQRVRFQRLTDSMKKLLYE